MRSMDCYVTNKIYAFIALSVSPWSQFFSISLIGESLFTSYTVHAALIEERVSQCAELLTVTVQGS